MKRYITLAIVLAAALPACNSWNGPTISWNGKSAPSGAQAPVTDPLDGPGQAGATPPPQTGRAASLRLSKDRRRSTEAAAIGPGGETVQEATQQTGDPRAQAAGYYGLARVALAKDEADDAETLLEKALTLEPEAQIRAWALVYLGKLRLEVADREHATKFFQDALQVEGASDAARREAQAGLLRVQNSKKEFLQ